jgi:CBS-domain-containing membrane protein
MNSAIERLLKLRVADVMARNVVQVPAHETMDKTAELLNQHDITGAPVVDELGRCVGVISGSDFVVRERARNGAGRPAVGHEQVLVQDAPGRPYHIEDIASDLVSQHMSAEVQEVAAEATLMDAARLMCGEHIHRVVVLDRDRRPVGLVSSLDVVAAVLHAIEE